MYRVAQHVPAVIAGIPGWISHIIAVDDASPDPSAQAALETWDPRVVVVELPVNQGVGGAVLAGLQKAREMGVDVAVKMDGDGQMRPEFLDLLVEPILAGRADYTKGNRFYHVQEIQRMPRLRRFGNLGLSFLTKLASGYWNVFDPTNGYTAMRMDLLPALNRDHLHPRYFFEISLLVELNLARAVVQDVPMPAYYAGEVSSLSISRSLLEFPALLLRRFLRRLWLQYFVLDFSAGSLFLVFGALLSLFGTLWGLFFWRKSILTGIPATTGTVMIAVLPFILGFQLLLQMISIDIGNVPKTVFRRGESKR